MKPLYYAFALENMEVTPISLLTCNQEAAEMLAEEYSWTVTDYGGGYHDDTLTLRQGLRESCNIYAALTSHNIIEKQPSR